MAYFLFSYLTLHEMAKGYQWTLQTTYYLMMETLGEFQFIPDYWIILNVS